MNLLLTNNQLGKLKQYSAPLIYLAVSQMMVHVNFPPFSYGGGAIKLAINIASSLFCIVCYTIIFLSDGSSAKMPKPMAITIYMQWGVFGLMHILYGYQWYVNFYQAPTSWYLVWYFQSASALAIIYYSLWRNKRAL